MSDVTHILEKAGSGDVKAAEELIPLVYEELRRMAARKMAMESPAHILQSTALVHEAWIRMTGERKSQGFANSAHFFGAAAEAMRRILIESARKRTAAKRGSGVANLNIDALQIPSPFKDDETLLRLDEALTQFALCDPRKAELIKLRYFIGLNYQEASTALGIAVPTAKEWWSYARAWLVVRMNSDSRD